MKIPKLRPEDLKPVEAKTANQQLAIDAWQAGSNLIQNGSAGTGKTYVAMAMALQTVLSAKSRQDAVVIVRSAVPTRDVGFLPGDIEEKTAIYQQPYQMITNSLIGSSAWERGIANGQIIFTTTSFNRGITLDRCVLLVDEMQNMSFHECDSIITRVGEDTRVMFCGDYDQSDFTNAKEKAGLAEFLGILETLSSFETVSYTWADIVRSALVREYICAKEQSKKSSNRVDPALPFLSGFSRVATPQP